MAGKCAGCYEPISADERRQYGKYCYVWGEVMSIYGGELYVREHGTGKKHLRRKAFQRERSEE